MVSRVIVALMNQEITASLFFCLFFYIIESWSHTSSRLLHGTLFQKRLCMVVNGERLLHICLKDNVPSQRVCVCLCRGGGHVGVGDLCWAFTERFDTKLDDVSLKEFFPKSGPMRFTRRRVTLARYVMRFEVLSDAYHHRNNASTYKTFVFVTELCPTLKLCISPHKTLKRLLVSSSFLEKSSFFLSFFFFKVKCNKKSETRYQ